MRNAPAHCVVIVLWCSTAVAETHRFVPTTFYDGIYGAAAGSWTTDMFVEAVFRSLSR